MFKSNSLALGHQECCRRAAAAVYTPDGTGIVREEIPALWAEFGVYGSEYTYIDTYTQNTEVGSEFRGGFFDLDEQAKEKGWSAGEKEVVARHMLQLLEKRPGWAQFSLYSKAPAAKPWAKYDETHHNKIAELADQFGCVTEALAYELENKKRESVVAKLTKVIAAQSEAVAAEESLTAA